MYLVSKDMDSTKQTDEDVLDSGQSDSAQNNGDKNNSTQLHGNSDVSSEMVTNPSIEKPNGTLEIGQRTESKVQNEMIYTSQRNRPQNVNLLCNYVIVTNSVIYWYTTATLIYYSNRMNVILRFFKNWKNVDRQNRLVFKTKKDKLHEILILSEYSRTYDYHFYPINL